MPAYNNNLSKKEKAICDLLLQELKRGLRKAESKIWKAYPFWFLKVRSPKSGVR